MSIVGTTWVMKEHGTLYRVIAVEPGMVVYMSGGRVRNCPLDKWLAKKLRQVLSTTKLEQSDATRDDARRMDLEARTKSTRTE